MSKYLKLRGKCNWAKYMKPDEKYGHFSIDLYPDEESLEKMKAAGVGLKPKEDTEGNTYYRFRRPNIKMINGEVVNFGPPEVVGVPDGVLIGNGSTVEIDVVVYEAGPYVGHRLNRITALELIPYSRDFMTGEDVSPVVVASAPPVASATPKGKKKPF